MPILTSAVVVAVVLGAEGQASSLSLAEATRVAMERNPELAEAAASARAASAGARAAGGLPDPMLSYQAWQQPLSRPDANDISWATMEGTVQRVRPKLMTVSTMMFGLVPLLWSEGTAADVMKQSPRRWSVAFSRPRS